MTKRSSKKVLKITNTSTNQLDASSIANGNTANFDYSSSINFSSDSIPPSATILSTKSKENTDVVLETGKYFKQKWRPVFVCKVFDIDDDENNNHNQSQSLLSSQTRNKRKVPPIKNSKKGKRFKNSSNNKTTTTTTTIIDSDDDNNDKDEENIDHQSNEPSNVWKYATRSRDKKFAVCTICTKRYQPIQRNVVTRRLKRLNQQKYNKLIEELKPIETITLSMDFWSDRSNRSFLVIT
ncbi:unnamed protein product, partial [Rotaria sordida]